jgi:hypothetical protein
MPHPIFFPTFDSFLNKWGFLLKKALIERSGPVSSMKYSRLPWQIPFWQPQVPGMAIRISLMH